MAITNSNIHKDTSISHIHEDPKLIIQKNAKKELKIGQVVYQDDFGRYAPALSSSDFKKGNIQGIVWSFIGEDQFYLRTAPGPMTYRHPLTSDFYSFISENEYVCNVPGNIGDILWLHETIPGYVQHELPADGHAKVIVGYKTEYGFLYQPKFIICCNGDSSSSSKKSSSSSSPFIDFSSSSSSIKIPPPPPKSSSSSSGVINDSSSSSSSGVINDSSSSSSGVINDSSSSSSSSSEEPLVCWYVYEAVNDCGWTLDPLNSYAVCLPDVYDQILSWVSLGGCRAIKIIKGPSCNLMADCSLPSLPLDDLPNWTPPNCCSSSSSSSSSQKYCWYTFLSNYVCGSWTTPTLNYKSCQSYGFLYEDGWNMFGPCTALKNVRGSACEVDGDCPDISTPGPTGLVPPYPEDCCDSSSSSSEPHYDYVCIWKYLADWDCETGSWWIRNTGAPLSCQSTVDFELPPQGWSGSGSSKEALVPKFTNTPCDEGCWPAPSPPADPPEPIKYWKYTCVAAPACNNGTLYWNVTSTLSDCFNSSLSDVNWLNITNECGDQKTYWVGPYSKRADVPAANCGEPSTPPGSACLPCSSSSSAICPLSQLQPPIGYVVVTIGGFPAAGFNAKMASGDYVAEIVGERSYRAVVWDDSYSYPGDSRVDTGVINVSIDCKNESLNPCGPLDTYGPAYECSCFNSTRPEGWSYSVSVSENYTIIGFSGNVRTSLFIQPLNDGVSRQSYTLASNFGGQTYWCDNNVSAQVT